MVDVTTILVNTGAKQYNEEFVVNLAYFPLDAVETLPGVWRQTKFYFPIFSELTLEKL